MHVASWIVAMLSYIYIYRNATTSCIVALQNYTQLREVVRLAWLVRANNWDAQLIEQYSKRTTTSCIVAMLLLPVACCFFVVWNIVKCCCCLLLGRATHNNDPPCDLDYDCGAPFPRGEALSVHNCAELQMTLATYGEPKAKNLNLNTWHRTFRRRDKNILQLIEKSVANNND